MKTKVKSQTKKKMKTERKKRRKHGNRKKYIQQNNKYKYNCNHCHYKTMSTKAMENHFYLYKCSTLFSNYRHYKYNCDHCKYKTPHKIYMENHFYLHKCSTLFSNYRHYKYKTPHKKYMENHFYLHKCSTLNNYQIGGQSRRENTITKKPDRKKVIQKQKTITQLTLNWRYYCHHCEYKTQARRSMENHFHLGKCSKFNNNHQTMRNSVDTRNFVESNVPRRVNPTRVTRSTVNRGINGLTGNPRENWSTANVSTVETTLKNSISKIRNKLDQCTVKISTKLVESLTEIKSNLILQESLNQCSEQVISACKDNEYIQHYMCGVCLTKYDGLKYIKHHMAWCVQVKKPLTLPKTCWNLEEFFPTLCFICQIELNHSDQYIIHMQIHQTSLIYMSEIAELSDHSVKKKYKCMLCSDYSTSFSSNLTHHVFRAHREKLLFRCDFCPFACMNLEVLNHHMQYIHSHNHCATILYKPVFIP
ncbi:hypothetical protein WDU94_003540 [Cyamophila willieti]